MKFIIMKKKNKDKDNKEEKEEMIKEYMEK